jgi:hypothetical protein
MEAKKRAEYCKNRKDADEMWFESKAEIEIQNRNRTWQKAEFRFKAKKNQVCDVRK